MSPTLDPGPRRRPRHTCGCGVSRMSSKRWHRTSNCRCEFHDPQLCPQCLDHQDNAAAEAWVRGNPQDFTALESYLAAAARHGPLYLD